MSIEPEWQPDFAMPDYKVIGKALLDVAFSYHYDDCADIYYCADIETQVDVLELWRSSAGASSPSRWDRPLLPNLGQQFPNERLHTHAETTKMRTYLYL